MEIKTFDTILTGICDSFDELIAPKKIARSNTNIIYLIFKAIAKGFELINNVCVTLSNKFDPLYCPEEDLESVANIVGTEKFKGTASGLHIIATNNGKTDVTLRPDFYTYAFDSDTTFEFEVMENIKIQANHFVDFIAMSENIGRFHVTEQNEITINSVQDIPSDLQFSCTDNTALLGNYAETNLEFRKRINTSTDRQNSLIELQNTIKNLPYIFDCKIKYNDKDTDEVCDGITIPPFTALIFYSGEIKSELAEIVASKIIFPTLNTVDSVAVRYNNEVFASGQYTAYFTPFARTLYSVEIVYKINNVYANDYNIQNEIRTALFNRFIAESHVDYIKEDDFYNTIEELEITGIEILGINLKYDGNNVNYIEVPVSRIPELTEVIFTQE